ncbi:MAG: hypothetical protein LBL28_05265, partial [Treponema sp.]|nr:hypothetical protein [Treponema sp.]
MKRNMLSISCIAVAVLGISCGGRGVVLTTPKNQAGTRSGVLPGYAADAVSAELEALPVENPPETVSAPARVSARERGKPENIDIEIKEKMFIAQTNDVYLNPEDYLGKTIKLEGLFKVEQYVGEDKRYCFVLRYGPGCCGNDGSAGFEVAWGRPQFIYPAPGKALSSEPDYPIQNAWVEAV